MGQLGLMLWTITCCSFLNKKIILFFLQKPMERGNPKLIECRIKNAPWHKNHLMCKASHILKLSTKNSCQKYCSLLWAHKAGGGTPSQHGKTLQKFILFRKKSVIGQANMFVNNIWTFYGSPPPNFIFLYTYAAFSTSHEFLYLPVESFKDFRRILWCHDIIEGSKTKLVLWQSCLNHIHIQ